MNPFSQAEFDLHRSWRIDSRLGERLSRAQQNMVGAYIPSFDLTEIDLTGADLSYALLWDVKLYGADARRAQFVNADMQDVYLADADASEANFTNANLHGAILVGSNLSHAMLRNASLLAVLAYSASMFECDLSGADCRRGDFRGVNFRRADLRGADFQNADLGGADLTGALVDEKTRVDYANLLGVRLPSGEVRPYTQVWEPLEPSQ